MRLNKYLSDAGVCSRRAADRAIEQGEVLINGIPAVVGQQVEENDTVTFRGQVVVPEEQEVILLVNKPEGIVCTAEKREKDNIVDYIDYSIRVYPVGRLDKNSRGLILMTNQGDIVNRMMRAGNYHEKEYEVKVNRPVTDEFIQKMSEGVYLHELGQKTRPCRVVKTGKNQFTIILTQGLNRQIRRMCLELGYRVQDLKRVRIMNIELGNLPEGSWREITEKERTELMKLIANSGSQPRFAAKSIRTDKPKTKSESTNRKNSRNKSGSVYRNAGRKSTSNKGKKQ